jgi:cell division protein FtsB
MTSPSAPGKIRRLGQNYRLLAGIALVMGGVMMLVILFSHRGLYQIYRLRHDRLSLEQENARLEQENLRLARTIDRLHHDPVLIQDLIRKELNFVKPNEIIFQFPQDQPKAGASLPDRQPAEVKPQPARKGSAPKYRKSARVCPASNRTAKKSGGSRLE